MRADKLAMSPKAFFKLKPLLDELTEATNHLHKAIDLAEKGGYIEPDEIHEAVEAIYHYHTMITQSVASSCPSEFGS